MMIKVVDWLTELESHSENAKIEKFVKLAKNSDFTRFLTISNVTTGYDGL